ncbi:MAG: type II secretion system F family protein [Planctomycetes bacterium]|jgi:general secretion pathway protein F/type IV pilus assembly protein PilC|nr:type II secretion system F family protein [Planctomycetota bacterium]
MATYQYIAKTTGGEQVVGTMQADSEASVVRTLGDRELFPVSVSARDEAARVLRGARIRSIDVGVAFRQLGELLHAGVPVLRSLDVIIRASRKRQVVEVLRDVRDAVSKGETLAAVMQEHPEAFTTLHVAMVTAGEEGGFLEDVLENMAAFIERQDELRSKVRGAMIYPLVLTIVGALAMLGILLVFVPMFRGFFAGVSLPAPTRMIFAASSLLTDQWGLLLALVILTVGGATAFLKSDIGHRLWEQWRLKLPLLGPVSRSVSIARFCRIFGTMLRSGVPILRALAISKAARTRRARTSWPGRSPRPPRMSGPARASPNPCETAAPSRPTSSR